VQKSDCGMVHSEDDGAPMVTKFPDGKNIVLLERWKCIGAKGAGWQTWNGHLASMSTADDGAIWESDGDGGGRRRHIR
jgi:hypothetical protein